MSVRAASQCPRLVEVGDPAHEGRDPGRARRGPGPRCRRGRRRRRPPGRRTPGRLHASSSAWRLVPAPETRTTSRAGGHRAQATERAQRRCHQAVADPATRPPRLIAIDGGHQHLAAPGRRCRPSGRCPSGHRRARSPAWSAGPRRSRRRSRAGRRSRRPCTPVGALRQHGTDRRGQHRARPAAPIAHGGSGPRPGSAASSGKAGTGPSATSGGRRRRCRCRRRSRARAGRRAPSSTALGATAAVATAYIT